MFVGKLNTTTGKKLVRHTLAMHLFYGRNLLAVSIVPAALPRLFILP